MSQPVHSDQILCVRGCEGFGHDGEREKGRDVILVCETAIMIGHGTGESLRMNGRLVSLVDEIVIAQ